MQYHFTAPSISKPTYETLEEHSRKAFHKIERLLANDSTEPTLRISVNKDGDEFIVLAELHNNELIVSKAHDRDLRRAVDKTSHEMKTLLTKVKSRRMDHKITEKIQNLRNKLLNRTYVE